jgi:hypothetical protein
MPGRVSNWPAGWPSFTPKDNDPNDTYQQDLKKQIIAEYGKDNLRQAWIKTCKDVTTSMTEISKQGSASIPIFTLEEVLGPNSDKVMNRMKAAGCFVIREVVARKEADGMFKDLQNFVGKNSSITGWPEANPAIFHLYNTPVQLKLRTHPNQLKLQQLLNSLFSDATCTKEELVAQNQPVSYPDALRIRQPGQEFLGLGPHVDAGSLSRWADESYRNVYDKIFAGNPEDYDPYDITHRRDANPALFPSGVHCSALRTFQGWTALTSCGPGEGGLMLLPDVKAATAYMMLRPFFKPPQNGQWHDAEQWEWDTSAWFPGARRWDSQSLSLTSHPHLNMEKTLLSVPAVQPGDTIWWHADVSFLYCGLQSQRSLLTICQIRCAMQSRHSTTVQVLLQWCTCLRRHPHQVTKRTSGNTGKTWLLALHLMITSSLMVWLMRWSRTNRMRG